MVETTETKFQRLLTEVQEGAKEYGLEVRAIPKGMADCPFQEDAKGAALFSLLLTTRGNGGLTTREIASELIATGIYPNDLARASSSIGTLLGELARRTGQDLTVGVDQNGLKKFGFKPTNGSGNNSMN